MSSITFDKSHACFLNACEYTGNVNSLPSEHLVSISIRSFNNLGPSRFRKRSRESNLLGRKRTKLWKSGTKEARRHREASLCSEYFQLVVKKGYFQRLCQSRCKFLVDLQAEVATKNSEGLASINVAKEASVGKLLEDLTIS